MTRAQFKQALRQVFKVVGGGPANVTRSSPVINLFDGMADSFALKSEIPENAGFTLIQEGQFGTHPEFTSQADLNAYVLSQVANGVAVTVPDAPKGAQVDDVGNIFSHLAVPGYASAADYELEKADVAAGFSTPEDIYAQGGRIYYPGITGPHSVGSVRARVKASGGRPAGQFVSNATAFTGPVVVPSPTLTQAQPASGKAGDQIVFTGTNLSGAIVSFNGTPAAPVSNTATQIVVAVPAGAASGNFTATTNAGTATLYFTVVVPANVLPVANAGADATVTLPANQVVLMGSGSDLDGTIASYAWAQITGPNTAALASPTAQNTTASGLVAGLYQFRLTVTDDKGGSKTDDVVVTVNAAANNQLSAPANPTADPVSISSVRVRADAVPNATAYKMLRSTTQGGTYTQVGSTYTTPDTTDANLSPNTSYWWKWVAVGNGTTYSDSAQSTAVSGTTPSNRGILNLFLTGVSQSNGTGAGPRELAPTNLYIDNARAWGFDHGRNTIGKWTLGSVANGIPDQTFALDWGYLPETFPPYGSIGPAAGFMPAWLTNNAANAKEVMFIPLNTIPPLSSDGSDTDSWKAPNGLMAKWKEGIAKAMPLIRANGWVGVEVVTFNDLGESNVINGKVAQYYADMVSLMAEQRTCLLSFAVSGFTVTADHHGIVFKQQNYTETGGAVRNIAQQINPEQARLVANVAGAFKIELPDVDPVTSFQNQYGNNTLIHYTTPVATRMGAYYATVVNNNFVEPTPEQPAPGEFRVDNFDGAGTFTWETAFFNDPNSNGLVTVTNEQLVFIPNANQVSLLGLQETGPSNFVGGSFAAQVVQVLGDGGGNNNTQIGFFISTNYYVRLVLEGGVLYAQSIQLVGGAEPVFGAQEGATTFGSEPFNAALHKWWRVRHNAAQSLLYFETSTDGVTYTRLPGVPASAPKFAVTAVKAFLSGSAPRANPAPGSAIFDNVKRVYG